MQYDLCHLFGSINVPFSHITSLQGNQSDEAAAIVGQLKTKMENGKGDPILVVCRLGNDSQIAVKKFKELGLKGFW